MGEYSSVVLSFSLWYVIIATLGNYYKGIGKEASILFTCQIILRGSLTDMSTDQPLKTFFVPLVMYKDIYRSLALGLGLPHWGTSDCLLVPRK